MLGLPAIMRGGASMMLPSVGMPSAAELPHISAGMHFASTDAQLTLIRAALGSGQSTDSKLLASTGNETANIPGTATGSTSSSKA